MKMRVAMLGVLSPELQALRKERAAAANRVVPKPKRIRYKDVRVARMAPSALNSLCGSPHDPGDAPREDVVENPVTFEIPLAFGAIDRAASSVDEVGDRQVASEGCSTMEDEAFLDLPPMDMFCDDYFLEDMNF